MNKLHSKLSDLTLIEMLLSLGWQNSSIDMNIAAGTYWYHPIKNINAISADEAWNKECHQD